MSGIELARALTALEFRVEKDNEVGIVLSRGTRRVVVRHEPWLTSEAIALLLFAAGVSWLELAAVMIPEPVGASGVRAKAPVPVSPSKQRVRA